MTFEMTLAEYLTMAAAASVFYMASDYKNEPNMKVAATNINIKTHQLFSKQQILRVSVTTAQRKSSGDLTRICS